MSPMGTSTKQPEPTGDVPRQRPLLAPIILNSPPTLAGTHNGHILPASLVAGRKSPQPAQSRPNRDSIPALEPSPMIRSQSIPKLMPGSFLEDMEPPPVIPAAIEEGVPYRSRPSSQHSIRWKEDDDDDPRGGYTTPRRRGSGASESTTAWDMSPGGASSIGRSGDAGPSTAASRAKRRVGRIFGGPSTTSLEVEDDTYDGAATPASRMSVNYRRQSARPSGDYSTGDETETPIPAKKHGFFAKLKHLGHGSHGRPLSGWTVDSMDDGGQTPIGPLTPAPYSPAIHGIPYEDEEYMDERRGSMSQGSVGGSIAGGTRTAPGTPRLPAGPRRRATITNIGEESAAREARSSYSRRTSFRRITQFSHHRRSIDGAEPSSPTTPGYQSASAAKWRAIKAGIRMMGQRKKEESKIDREKSAELMAELTAVTPAVVIFASMFQRDEHGHRRIPILLEQLKVKISDTDKNPSKSSGRSHNVFRIELEYGSGLTRMKWVIYREFRDFFNLHSRYRLADISNTTFGGRDAHKLPKFPRATIPYLRGVRGLGSDEEDADTELSGTEGPNSKSPPGKKRPKHIRRNSSSVVGEHLHQGIATGLAAGLGTLTAPIGGAVSSGAGVPAANRKEGFAVKQRLQLEEYLRRLIRIMIFRPDSNRLCKFLELSALGVRLAAEGSYHGKEGYLIIRSAKGSDFRRVWNPAAMAKRHSPKWFLVRHSYIVCVDSPEEMNIYDVFLVDSAFEVDAKKFLRKKPKDLAVAPSNPAHPQHHSLTIQNGERQLKLLAKNERQLQQFHESIMSMKDNTTWAQPQRFQSFAPVRRGVFAQWLVDGRDYMWNVSRAISMAKDVIYIHDWWLSPELYLRRPAAVSQKWRLDRLLQRKAQEGVKIFVIVYRNIGAAVPIDSAYTKYSLLDLHPNVFVQRSPNQIRQATFFWAHHEKILIVDHMVAFLGGIDLCFGRWDTPQHSLVDDKPTGFEEGSSKGDPEDFQLWPGKDYSNPRVQDFYALDKPYEEMYDRQRVARMPWHDIHMQVVGQPARDLTRHFVQRWNYLLRQRTPSRPTPVLLPPPDFSDAELQSLGIDGTCEVQILRSACSWSLGTPNTTEASIMSAYIKSIELSDHFVYIENQFFITSTEWGGTVIENKIGDALVERIVRAYKKDEDWRAIVIIPLMPGFQNTVDSQDGTSIRLIMQCQYRSISRGEHSIFGRLRAQGIEPEEFIQFYGLRNWGKIGPEKALVTEQLYIHAKCMVVDDRIAIIGSANINERSMLGNRDSEVAAIVRDTDTIMSTMAGQPYRVGRFPHTLRLRLMREHLGMDVDEIMAKEQMEAEIRQMTEDEKWLATHGDDGESLRSGEGGGTADYVHEAKIEARAAQDQQRGPPGLTKSNMTLKEEAVLRSDELRSFNHDVDWEQENNPNIKTRKKETTDSRIHGNDAHQKDLKGHGHDKMKEKEEYAESLRAKGKRKASGASRMGVENVLAQFSSTARSPQSQSTNTNSAKPVNPAKPATPTDSTNITNPASPSSQRTSSRGSSSGGLGNNNLPPLPGSERMNSFELGLPQLSQLPPLPVTSDLDIGGPCLVNRPNTAEGGTNIPELGNIAMPIVTPDMFEDPLDDSFYLDIWHACAANNTKLYRQVFRCMPDNEVKTWAAYKEYAAYGERFTQSMGLGKSKMRTQQETNGKSGPPGAPTDMLFGDKLGEKVAGDLGINLKGDNKNLAQGNVKDWTTPNVTSPEELEKVRRDDPSNEKIEFHPPQHVADEFNGNRPRSTSHASSRLNTAVTTATTSTVGGGGSFCSNGSGSKQDPNYLHSAANVTYTSNTNLNGGIGSTKRRRRGTTRSSKRDFHASEPLLDKDVAERLLDMTQGHLVIWPYDWLLREEEGGNWLYSIDQLAPIEIYD